MSALTLCPATLAHLGVMQRRVDLSLDAAPLAHALTVMRDNLPLCCWGIQTFWPRVGMAWFLERYCLAGDPQASRIARAIARTWEQWQPDFRYVEALVLADREDSQRLIRWCGFEYLATKVGYGPGGETMHEYVWRADDGG